MRIAMCDDEPIILDELQKFCTACYKRAGISPTWLVSSDPNCFIDELEAFEPELILLDIDMPRLTGFDIAGELLQRNNRALLIFITNQESLVYETFSTNHLILFVKAVIMRISNVYYSVLHTKYPQGSMPLHFVLAAFPSDSRSLTSHISKLMEIT